MSSNIATRPSFFEGQYLGQSDLCLLLQYLRDADRQDRLSIRTQGIAAGLTVHPETDALGQVSWFVLPGMAIDGYGRTILVLDRHEISPADLTGQPVGPVEVWIGYLETPRTGVRPGFEVCDSEAFARVDEGYLLAFGRLTALDARRDGINVDGQEIADAREVMRSVADAEGPILCDGSAGYQRFPDPAEARRWLIPLGHVGWTGAGFRTLDADAGEVQAARAAREFADVVTERIHAAEGVIRLARRDSPPPAPGNTNDSICEARRLQPGDFVADPDDPDNRVIEDLVWVEGHLRALGDLRLWGTELSFRNADGSQTTSSGQLVPLALRRSPGDGLTPETQDIELALGLSTQTDAANRLVVGRRNPDGTLTPVAALTGLGRLGLGTDDPGSYLAEANGLVIAGAAAAGLTIHATNGAIHFAQGLSQAGQTRGRIVYSHGTDHLVVGTAGEDRVWIDNGGRLGLGAEAPGDFSSDADDLVIFREGSAGLTIATHADSGDAVASSTTARINFGRGSDATDGDVGSIVYRHANDRMDLRTNATTHMSIESNGDVGLGTTSPVTRLHVNDADTIDSLGSSEGAVTVGSTSSEHLKLDRAGMQALLQSNSAGPLQLQRHGGGVRIHSDESASRRVRVTETGELGLGTDTPSEKLEVRGRVALGTTGSVFAQAGVAAELTIRGTVNGSGTPTGGSGFTALALPAQTGRYQVIFTTPFLATPTVVATPHDEIDSGDNLLTLSSVTATGFVVRIVDVGLLAQSGQANAPVSADEDATFSFIAIGPASEA